MPWGAAPGAMAPDGESGAGRCLFPGILLPSSGGWRRESKLLRFCPALSAGTGSGCPAAPAHILATACPEPSRPEPGTGALPPGNHLSCPNSSPEHHPSLPAQCSAALLPLSQQPGPAWGNGRHPARTLPWQAVPKHLGGGRAKGVLPGWAHHLPETPSSGLRVPLCTAQVAPRDGSADGTWTCREPLCHARTPDPPSPAVAHLLAGGWP